jgi:hypothetical protein
VRPNQKSRARLVYECLDIHRLMLGSGPISAMLRAIERACLKHAALLMTSSPAFIAHYFRLRQNFKGQALIVENRILTLDNAAPTAKAAPAILPPWKIAWCGVLRCAKSFEILERVTQALHGKLEVELWGAPAHDQIPGFDARIAAAPWMNFHGRYAVEDLPRIYGHAHFIWAIDYYEAGGNSDWLLPNRLYEGLAFGSLPIAIENVETARWLEQRQVGIVLNGELGPALETFLRESTPEKYQRLRAAAEALDPAATRFNRDDCRALLDQLAGGEAGRAA